MTDRLSRATLPRVPAAYRPRIDPGALGVGIVHLGLGAFHRAHQAVFTEDAIASAGGDWGICGVTQRSRIVFDQLAPQDGLYSVLVRHGGEPEVRVVGAVREVLWAAADPEAVVRRIADPAVRVVTLTVTEKGYRHDPAAGNGPATVVGQLARGIQARIAAGAGPLTVLSCDNLAHNGRTLAGVVRDFVDLLPAREAAPLHAAIAAHVRFPSSVVDRIVPAPTDADRAEVRRLIGLDDAGAVATEAFRQWVIEDDFPGGRPQWEDAGALLVRDVAPYETVKLRMLNGAHSTLAYLGALAGCATIAEAMDRFGNVVQSLLSEDVRPTLQVPDGFDLDEYERRLLTRFGNPALPHRVLQVAADGSQKLPARLLATIRDRRAAGAEPRWAAYAVAAWLRWIQVAPELDDPLADRLHEAVAVVATPAAVVDRLLAVRDVFGEDLAEDAVVRDLLVDALQRLSLEGVA